MQEVEFDVGDIKLYGQEWLVQGTEPAKAFIIFNHGLNDHVTRIDVLFSELVKYGYSIIAYDQRGQGKSATTFWQQGLTNTKHVYSDLDKIIERVLDVHSPKKLFMMGHSTGGGITINYACDGKLRDKLAGFIVIAPWVGALHEASRQPAWKLGAVKLVAKVAPWVKGRVPLDPHLLCEDPEIIKAALSDPHTRVWATVGQISSALDRAERVFDPDVQKGYDINKPLLITTGKQDKVCDHVEAQRLYEAFSQVKDRQIVDEEDAWHEPFRALKPVREKYAAMLAEWLDKH